MKRLLPILFVIHLLLIFFQSLQLTVDTYSSFHYNKKTNVPVLTFLKTSIYDSQYTAPFFILTGTNTGYGFYGINTATEKYLTVNFFDSTGHALKTDRYFNMSTSNGFSRLKGFATYLTNYIAETEKMKKEKNISPATQSAIDFRELYVDKVFKWLGKKEAAQLPSCATYKISLLTIVPINIWSDEGANKPKIYVIKEKLFPVS